MRYLHILPSKYVQVVKNIVQDFHQVINDASFYLQLPAIRRTLELRTINRKSKDIRTYVTYE